VYLQETSLTILDMIARHLFYVCGSSTFWNVVGGLGWSNMCNCAPCHFPNVDCQIDASLVMFVVDLCCMLCGQQKNHPYHNGRSKLINLN